jgi:hypothetical protein
MDTEIRNVLPPVDIPPAPPTPPRSLPKISPKYFYLLIGLILTTTIFATGYVLGNLKTGNMSIDESLPTPAPSSFPETTITPSSPSITDAPPKTSGEVSWLPKPKELSKMDIFVPNNKSEYVYRYSEAKFFQTGTLADQSQLINVYLPTEGMGVFNTIFRLTQSPSGTISFIDQGEYSQWTNLKGVLKSDITVSPYKLRDLDPPPIIVHNKYSFTRGYAYHEPFSSLKSPKLIKDTEYGSIYAVYSEERDGLPGMRGRLFYLRLRDDTLYTYTYNFPSFSDDRIPGVTWSDGSYNKTQFKTNLRVTCGANGAGTDVIRDNLALITNRQEVGKLTTGEAIYQVKDKDNPIIKELYSSYKSGRDYPSAPPVLDIDRYVQSRNHFLVLDEFGDWQLLISQDYSPMAECGKPVIYLYPTKPTDFTVKVGADVTVSEPSYNPATGWIGTAYPDGRLVVEGKDYSSLFWEGKGWGEYADLSQTGVVIRSSQVKNTLISQLKHMNLNDREIADFLDFWLPRIPSTNYVRLTWLQTPEMNRLAPLSTSFKPDTSIRVFLEFEGLDQYKAIKPQKLVKTPRKGFTLVEWGGLLIKLK